MIPNTVFIYDQVMPIVLTENILTPGRNEMFYSKPMTLFRGIDNTVKFSFKNSDQKKVPIHQKTITFNIIDNADHSTHLTRTMSVEDGNNGIAKLVITEADLLDIKEQYYTWSVKVVNGENEEFVAYVDDNFGAKGELQVKHGVFPQFAESVSLGFRGGNTTAAVEARPKLNNNAALHTAQFYFDQAYTGTITVQGTLDDIANQTSINWFDIKTVTYTADTSPQYTTWNGVFSAVRFVKADTTGTVESVLYRH